MNSFDHLYFRMMCRVTSDNSQMASDWDLKEMIIWKILPHDESIPVYFPFNQWLGDKTKRLKSKAEIYRSKDYRIRGKSIRFSQSNEMKCNVSHV